MVLIQVKDVGRLTGVLVLVIVFVVVIAVVVVMGVLDLLLFFVDVRDYTMSKDHSVSGKKPE